MSPQIRAHLGDGHSEHSDTDKDEESGGQADCGGHPLAHLSLYQIMCTHRTIDTYMQTLGLQNFDRYSHQMHLFSGLLPPGKYLGAAGNIILSWVLDSPGDTD